MFAWKGQGNIGNGNACWACFQTSGDGTSIKQGDKGVGVCYNTTGQGIYNGSDFFSNYGTIKARSSTEFTLDDNQGWDSSFKLLNVTG